MDADNMLVDAADEVERFKSLSMSCKGKLETCTCKMNEIKALMERSIQDFKEVHKLVKMFLSEEIQEKEKVDWDEPKMSTFEDFLEDVEKWKTSQTDPQSPIGPQDSISNVSKRS